MAKIYALYGQRVCRYEGEYAPELLEACDDLTMDDNPSWMEKKRRDWMADPNMEEVRLITIAISDSDIDRAFKKVILKATPLIES